MGCARAWGRMEYNSLYDFKRAVHGVPYVTDCICTMRYMTTFVGVAWSYGSYGWRAPLETVNVHVMIHVASTAILYLLVFL